MDNPGLRSSEELRFAVAILNNPRSFTLFPSGVLMNLSILCNLLIHKLRVLLGNPIAGIQSNIPESFYSFRSLDLVAPWHEPQIQEICIRRWNSIEKLGSLLIIQTKLTVELG